MFCLICSQFLYTTSLDTCFRLLGKVINIHKFMLYITMYKNTETTRAYYISYEGLSCKNSFSKLFMHTWVLTLHVAMQENTAMESKHTVLIDIW